MAVMHWWLVLMVCWAPFLLMVSWPVGGANLTVVPLLGAWPRLAPPAEKPPKPPPPPENRPDCWGWAAVLAPNRLLAAGWLEPNRLLEVLPKPPEMGESHQVRERERERKNIAEDDFKCGRDVYGVLFFL